MKVKLNDIAEFQSGIYAKPQPMADTLYLQGVHFNEFGEFDRRVKPTLSKEILINKHILKTGDILFSAKGLNNMAFVYDEKIGPAAASSSFIVMRLKPDQRDAIDPEYLAWYLSNHPEVRRFHKQLGSTIPSISITQLSTLMVNIPDLEIQRQIVKIQELRNREKQLITKLSHLKDEYLKRELLQATA